LAVKSISGLRRVKLAVETAFTLRATFPAVQ
jgi:hypothetical protein